jgi:hypothetical protein
MIVKVSKGSMAFLVARSDDAKAVETQAACLDWESVVHSLRDLKLPPKSLAVMRQQVESVGFAEVNLPSTWLLTPKDLMSQEVW